RLERQADRLGEMDRAIGHAALSDARLFWWAVLLRTAMVDGPHLVRRQGREMDRCPGPRRPAPLYRPRTRPCGHDHIRALWQRAAGPGGARHPRQLHHPVCPGQQRAIFKPEKNMSLKFTVGDLTIHRIIEQETTFLPALEMLPGLTPELLAENRAWMQKAGALDDNDVLILCFQSYVVKTPHHTILIDSCIGNDKPRPLRPKWNMKTDDTYLRALAGAGFTPGDIDYVMCTHLHVDHVGWNTKLENGRWVPTFPKARYVFGKTEFDYWTETHAKTPVPAFGDSVLPVVEARQAEIVRSGYQSGDHTRLLPTPGHTPGHVAFTFGRGKDDAVFSGDLMHSPLQTRYPELSAKFDVDHAQAAATRRNFMERYCGTDTLCC